MKRCAPTLLVLLALILVVGPAAAAQTRAYVVTSDFVTGGLSVVDLNTRGVSADVATVGSDPAIRFYGDRVDVINRSGADNIQEIDPIAAYATALQFSTGAGTNPQDIALLTPTKAYVSRYDSPSILICNPQNGATLGTISLAGFADADGLPEMAHLAIVGHRLFVAVQRLDRNTFYSPTAFSLVVAIDTDADTVLDANPGLPGVQGITLTYKNPFSTMTYDRNTGRLYVGCTGAFGVNDGGVEAIDVNTLTDLGSVVTEAALGGDLSDFEIYSPTHAYAIVSDAGFNTNLVSWNPTTHLGIGTVWAPGGFSLSDCAVNDRGELYVGNNGFSAPGIYVYRAGADTLITGPLGTGLPPVQIAFDEARSEVASATPASGAITFSAPWPNPARAGARFALTLSVPTAVRVEAFDVTGRRVRTLANETRGAGASSIGWDLTDADGRRVGVGVYLIRATLGATSVTRRLAVVR